jgi:hypothetical protein
MTKHMRRLIAVISAEYDENGPDPVNTQEFDRLFDNALNVEVLDVDDRLVTEFGSDRFVVDTEVPDGPTFGKHKKPGVAIRDGQDILAWVHPNVAEGFAAKLNKGVTQ